MSRSTANLSRVLLVVFLLGFACRAGLGLVQHLRRAQPAKLTFPDEQQYWLISRSMRAGEGMADELGFQAGRMPLYPGLLALFPDSATGVLLAKAMQWIIGGLTAAMVALLATRLADRRVGWLAGLLVAFDPHLVYFSSLLLTETLFVLSLTLLALALVRVVFPRNAVARVDGRREANASSAELAATKVCVGAGKAKPPAFRHWFAVAVAACLVVYAREAGLAIVAAWLLLAVVAQRFKPAACLGVVVVVVAVVLALLPWAARNKSVTGQWVWLTTRGGISLYDGLGPQADGSSNLGDVKQSQEVRDLSEVAYDAHFRRAAWASLRDDPARILRLSGNKLLRTWNPLPNAQEGQSALIRLISAAWTIPLYILAAWGVVLWPLHYELDGRVGGGWRLDLFLLLPAIVLSGLHMIFVGSVRYRLGAMPMLEILAAGAALILFQRLLNRPRVAH